MIAIHFSRGPNGNQSTQCSDPESWTSGSNIPGTTSEGQTFQVRLIVILYSPNSYFFYCWICIMLCTSFLPMHILVWLYFILYSRTYSTTNWIILELIHLLIAWLYLQARLGGKACFPVGKKGRKRLITKHLQSDQWYSWKLFHDFQKIESL